MKKHLDTKRSNTTVAARRFIVAATIAASMLVVVAVLLSQPSLASSVITTTGAAKVTAEAYAQIAPPVPDSLNQSSQQQEQSATSAIGDDNDNNDTITIVGTATTRVKPDKVILVFAVETMEETAKEALDRNAEAMSNVLDALTAAGVNENETSTSFFSISPNYNYTETGNVANLTGYTVTNAIQIESKNLQNISDWIDTAVQAGANRIDSVSFTLSEDLADNIRISLIERAVDNANKKAEILASALGLNIIGIKDALLNEGIGPIEPFVATVTAADAAAAETPIIVGEQTVTISVTVVYKAG